MQSCHWLSYPGWIVGVGDGIKKIFSLCLNCIEKGMPRDSSNTNLYAQHIVGQLDLEARHGPVASWVPHCSANTKQLQTTLFGNHNHNLNVWSIWNLDVWSIKLPLDVVWTWVRSLIDLSRLIHPPPQSRSSARRTNSVEILMFNRLLKFDAKINSF